MYVAAMLTRAERIELALAACRQRPNPQYKTIAREFNVDRTTLSRRHKGTQRSYQESRSECIQNLNTTQENILIKFINRLSQYALPPTSQIVKNSAEELCGHTVGKNWVGQFVARHRSVLHSAYLRSIDNKRYYAENWELIQQFYDQVFACFIVKLIM